MDIKNKVTKRQTNTVFSSNVERTVVLSASCLFDLEFYGPVKNVKVMSSRTINLLTLFSWVGLFL